MNVKLSIVTFSSLAVLVATTSFAGPPSKTAVTTKLACGNTVGNATASVSLCAQSEGAICFSGFVACPQGLSCGTESTSGERTQTIVCDLGFTPQAFSYSIVIIEPNPGGCAGVHGGAGSVSCEASLPKLTVR
jgi:hypothetical protein